MDNERYPCPCCGEKIFEGVGLYEICPVCDWEDDPIQSSDPDYSGGANALSLYEARELFKKRNVHQ
ncbi:CPCC family cysteine-rich protein [Trabulsiella odontotermitis]|uniref:CPCC family cysteine-rich protein n=1 Tax=Trabulsiella odontotermitis TaxID=379893 RepID=UPI00092E5774|nr:CPCC family cysteine-rich protein [Trabulsiella odontotermitis]